MMGNKVSRDLARGDAGLLALSLLQEGDLYGYQLIRQLEDRSDNIFHLSEGTLYPVLHALEQEGCLESYWSQPETEGARRRKYYRLTRKGRTELARLNREWQTYTQAVAKVLNCRGESPASVHV